jgi:hypothetical protein
MRRREPPPLFNFETGAKLEGTLISATREKLGDSHQLKYTIEKPTGERVSFWGLAGINSVMRLPGDIGHAVSIHCIGKDANPKPGQSAMKVFEIEVSDEIMDKDSTYITDDDINF